MYVKIRQLHKIALIERLVMKTVEEDAALLELGVWTPRMRRSPSSSWHWVTVRRARWGKRDLIVNSQ